MGATGEEKAAYAALVPEDRARVSAMMNGGRSPSAALRSVLDQNDAYAREQPTIAERAGAAGLAAADVASLGLADEAAGAMRALAPQTERGTYVKGFTDRYRAGRDEQRAQTEEAKDTAPGAYGAGELGATLASAAIPGRAMRAGVLPAAATSGAIGATAGFGSGEGAVDSVARALAGGAVGAGLGGGAAMAAKIPAAIRGLRMRAPSAAGVVDDVTGKIIAASEQHPLLAAGLNIGTGGISGSTVNLAKMAQKGARALRVNAPPTPLSTPEQEASLLAYRSMTARKPQPSREPIPLTPEPPTASPTVTPTAMKQSAPALRIMPPVEDAPLSPSRSPWGPEFDESGMPMNFEPPPVPSKAGVWTRMSDRDRLVAGKTMAEKTPQQQSPPFQPLGVGSTTATGAAPSPVDVAALMRQGDKRKVSEVLTWLDTQPDAYKTSVEAALNQMRVSGSVFARAAPMSR